MTDEQYQGLKEMVSDQIRITVNGKIDKITEMMVNHIKDDANWKKEAQPVVDAGKNLSGWGRITVALVAFIAALVAAITGIMKLLGK